MRIVDPSIEVGTQNQQLIIAHFAFTVQSSVHTTKISFLNLPRSLIVSIVLYLKQHPPTLAPTKMAVVIACFSVG